jgi:predicted RNA-binding protein with TRAM domain
MNVRMVFDSYMCGKVNVDVAIREIAQLCKKVDGRKAVFGWTLIVEGCEWDDVEDVVAEVGGDIVYMR